MQNVFKRNSNTSFVCESSSSLTTAKETYPHNFAKTLPLEMSLRIFSELDIDSLCNASLTCKLWHHIIEGCDHLWRNHCLTVRAVCQQEIDGDRQNGLSWKVTLVRNYRRGYLKREWLRGRFSNIGSADELVNKHMCPLDVESWGEILEAELER
ncbi:F-box only protein 48 [Esox lucius]|uniref:F-box domain-containing protein n=1 Tax=Esox lucius TaxID=8010 RepID=A0A3P8Y490_ESOLU|nr:F-box only protein 48 [Esox lucius]